MGIPSDFLKPCGRTSIRIPYNDAHAHDLAALPLGEILIFPPGPDEDNYLIARFQGYDSRKGMMTASAVAFVAANYQGEGLPPHETHYGTRTLRHTAERAHIGQAAFELLANDPRTKPFAEHLAQGHRGLIEKLAEENRQLYIAAALQ